MPVRFLIAIDRRYRNSDSGTRTVQVNGRVQKS
jgi:hypothetical protein